MVNSEFWNEAASWEKNEENLDDFNCGHLEMSVATAPKFNLVCYDSITQSRLKMKFVYFNVKYLNILKQTKF